MREEDYDALVAKMEELGMDRVYELRDQLMREHPGRN